MLDFVIFAVTFAVVLVAAVLYLYPGSRRVTTIPGMDPSDTKDGNLSDITSAGGFHPFLTDLHEKFGPIAGFWFGEQYTVSLASPELFKQQLKIFDRPSEPFRFFEPILGSSALLFANGADGRQRRKSYDRYFAEIKNAHYFSKILPIGENMVGKWASLPAREHIPLHQYMSALALKSILTLIFGSTISEKNIIQFRRLFEVVWSELSSRIIGNSMNSENSHDKIILQNISDIRSIIRNVIVERKSLKKREVETFVDYLIREEQSEERQLNDCITFIVGGFHTTGNLLTWALYYLASNQDKQEKVHQELSTVNFKDVVEQGNITSLKYVRSVIDETLRCAVLSPFAARCQDIATEIGGHIIPKGTPVLQALGVVLNDPKIWTSPDEFNPDRFQNVDKLQSLTLCPFGFAGGRTCPGQRFAYFEATVYLSMFLKRFKIDLVEGQVVTPVYGLITRPEEEIWVTISPRNN